MPSTTHTLRKRYYTVQLQIHLLVSCYCNRILYYIVHINHNDSNASLAIEVSDFLQDLWRCVYSTKLTHHDDN